MSHQIGNVPLRRLPAAVAALTLLLVAPALVVLAAAPAEAQGTVTVAVIGSGSVTGPGISCGSSGGPDCGEHYSDTSYEDCDPERKPPCITITEAPYVELTAGADQNGYVYDGWSGCDAVSGRVCGITVTGDTSLTARYRDVQPPALSAWSPGAGAVVGGAVPLSVAATDNAGSVARVEFFVDGVQVGLDSTAPYSLTLDTTTVSDGSRTLTARAFDAAGLSSSISSSVTVDNTAPIVDVTAGPDDDVVASGATHTWSFSAADATTDVVVECSLVEAGSARSFTPCTGGAVSHSVSGLGAGAHEFTVRARDEAANRASATRLLTVDSLSPTITRLRPRTATTTRDRTPLVGATVRDQVLPGVAGPLRGRDVRLFVDDVRRRAGLDGTRLSWQAPRLSRGRHAVRVVVTDGVGNRASKRWWFKIGR